MWRKNRQPNSGSWCIGTDPNRNFKLAFGKPGASSYSCADDWRGPSAFSAPESKALADYMNLVKPVSYIDFHSYSELVMFPWGYDCGVVATDDAVLREGALRSVKALKAVHGESFRSGDICNTIYQASGTTVDYAYGSENVKFSYTFELRDTGSNGFVLPAKLIVPSGEETLAAVVELWTFAASKL